MSLQHASPTMSPAHFLRTEVALATMILSPTSPQIHPTVNEHPTALSIMLSSGTAAAIAITNSSNSDSRPGAENGECRLLGPFALIVQGALGALALLSLVYKRWRERPQRPLKIWAFDASKQVFGSVLLHIANLLMSMLSSGQLTVKPGDYQANPCSFYLLNLAIDVSNTRTLSLLRSSGMVLTYSSTDHGWHPHPHRPSSPSTPRLFTYPTRQSPRIHPIRPLWPSASRNMVA